MKTVYAYAFCAGWISLAATVQADIVWSGEQNLSGNYQYIDLNFDSLIDATLAYDITGDLSADDGRILVYVDRFSVDGSNRILVDPLDNSDAALPFGTLISDVPASSMEWKGGTYAAGLVSSWAVYNPDFPGPPLVSDEEWRGLLGTNGNTYVGIEFDIAGSTHYGWINIALGEEGYLGFEEPITASWAYESTPGAPIAAGAIPEPSTGILSLLGAVGLFYLRRARLRGKQACDPLPRRHKLVEQATPDEW